MDFHIFPCVPYDDVYYFEKPPISSFKFPGHKSHIRLSSVCWKFSARVESEARLFSDVATFGESDLTQSRNVNVVFLELHRYYGVPLFGSAWVGFVSLLDVFILGDILVVWVFFAEVGFWQGKLAVFIFFKCTRVCQLLVCFSPSPKRYYLPTPPLGQDMTQGQFLSGV